MNVKEITRRNYHLWYERAEEKFTDGNRRRFFRAEDDLWIFCMPPRRGDYLPPFPDEGDLISGPLGVFRVIDATINNFGKEQKTKSRAVGQLILKLKN
jgi:hypothetical protein